MCEHGVRRHEEIQIKIPFNKPAFFGSEMANIRNAIHRGHLSGDGHYTRECERSLEKLLGASRVLLTSSGTHALELAALLLNLKPGDEVIAPSFTFPSTVNAFLLRGARPRFVDIRPDTLNLDETQVEANLDTPHARRRPGALCGNPLRDGAACSFGPQTSFHFCRRCRARAGCLLGLPQSRNLCAPVGASFHETKNVSSGEGGALIITDPTLTERAEIIRQKGTNRAQFYRGLVDKYSWVDLDRPMCRQNSPAFAYQLFSQLNHFKEIQRRRRAIYERYRDALCDWELRGRVQLPVIPTDVVTSHHLFHVLLESEKERNRVMDALKRKGITSVFHYFPFASLSKWAAAGGYRPGQFPVSERASAQLLRLPLYNQMSIRQQDYILKCLNAILK